MHHIIIDFSQRRSVPMRPPPVRARVRRRRRRATTRRRDERNSSPPTPIPLVDASTPASIARNNRSLASSSPSRAMTSARASARALVLERAPRGCSRTRGPYHRDRDASRASRSTPARRDDEENARTRRAFASSRLARRRARRTRVESPPVVDNGRVVGRAAVFVWSNGHTVRSVVCVYPMYTLTVSFPRRRDKMKNEPWMVLDICIQWTVYPNKIQRRTRRTGRHRSSLSIASSIGIARATHLDASRSVRASRILFPSRSIVSRACETGACVRARGRRRSHP